MYAHFCFNSWAFKLKSLKCILASTLQIYIYLPFYLYLYEIRSFLPDVSQVSKITANILTLLEVMKRAEINSLMNLEVWNSYAIHSIVKVLRINLVRKLEDMFFYSFSS